METLLRDIRYGVRLLIKSPASAVIAVVALALGIGANTAIFSVVNAILLRPLPYNSPDRLVMIWESNPEVKVGFDLLPVAVGNFVDWRDQNQVFEEISILDGARFALTGLDKPEMIGGASVSSSFFQLMKVEAMMGRTFLPEEDRPGANQVVVISHSLWQNRFGSDPEMVGKNILLDGQKFTVVGVMPEGFHFPRQLDLPSYFRLPPQSEVWTPIGLTDAQISNRESRNKGVIARLKSKVSLEEARAEMNIIAGRLEQQYKDNEGFGVTLVPLQEQLVGNVRVALFALLGAVGFVLAIACANVANLLLARSSSRQKEIAIRAALGASRGQVIRQLLTESVMLSLAGGALGILLALWGIDLLLALSPDNIPRKHEINVDTLVLGFNFAISVVTGILFGLAPAVQATRVSLNENLKEGARGSTGGFRHNRVRSLLVVTEVALSLVLLIGAGLMIKSFIQILKVDPGFKPQNVLTMNVSLPQAGYDEQKEISAFFKKVIERLKVMPGAESASAITDLPLGGGENINGFYIEGAPVPTSISDMSLSDTRTIDFDYFNVMGIPLVAGRYFTERDDENAPGVAIINQSLARRFFAGEQPIGKRIKGGDHNSDTPWLTVVGVVGDVKHSGLDAEFRPQLYYPYLQNPDSRMTLIVRINYDPSRMVASVKDEIWAVDKDLPITEIKTLEQYLNASVSQRRFNVLLLGLFGAIAMILAAVGIYGVISYSVTQRTHEIGIRMALGAQHKDVIRLVVSQAMGLTLAGLLVGLAAAFALTRMIESLLFAVSATDPVTFLAISLLLAGVALAASLIPARRAARVDPMIALRHE